MGFLDNSGDIILDAVLTDTGRKMLAKGDGSFRVAQFALFDDEIDYGLYDSAHPSGSAYYDLSILQTPIFEAFTNNFASSKSKLMTIPRTNLLYLPVLKLNDLIYKMHTVNGRSVFPVAVDVDTYNSLHADFKVVSEDWGFIAGGDSRQVVFGIQIDQGLDTTAISPVNTLDADLKETAYVLELDNRFGSVAAVTKDGTVSVAIASYVDDDEVASYYLSTEDSAYVFSNTDTSKANTQVIAGPRGTTCLFRVEPALNIQASDYYFTKVGKATTINGNQYNIIETAVRVFGATTGSGVVVPITYVKSA